MSSNSEAVLLEHVRDLGLDEIITGLQAKGWFTMRHRPLHDQPFLLKKMLHQT